MDEYQAIMTRKLGLPKYNKQLISKLLNNMAVDKVDYTNFFRILSNIKADLNIPEEELLVPLKAVLLDIGKERKEAWTSWVQTYIQEVPTITIFLIVCYGEHEMREYKIHATRRILVKEVSYKKKKGKRT